jgi:uncharacterized membrane protein
MSGDGLRFTTRNIIFMVLTLISFGALYGVYFELSPQIRDEPLYLSFFILATILLVIFLTIILYDSFTNRDLKMDRESANERMEEIHTINERMPKGSYEYPQEIIGKDKKYHHNSFEKSGNLWRSLFIFVIALLTYVSFVITYLKHSKDKRDSIGYIIALSLASIALAAHVGLLGYQIYEVFNIDRAESIQSIKKYQKRRL